MVDKNTTVKAETKTATTKRTSAAAKKVVDLSPENVGFKAGDVYQALAAAGTPLNVKEIQKAAKIAEAEVLLGIGWLYKEGKILLAEDNKIMLA